MTVYITSCEIHENAWRHQEHRLTKLWQMSSRVHVLTPNPSDADIIIIGNIRDEFDFRSLRNHAVARQYPTKAFAVDERDDWTIIPFLPGVYASAHRHLPIKKRYCSGSYSLYHEDFKNPYIEKSNLSGYSHEKKHLASFIGRRSHKVRDALFDLKFKNETVIISDTSTFNLFTHESAGKLDRQRHYSSVMASSKFAICPRGAGASSIRLFEAMKSGVAPVIFSDDWIVPLGPDWKKFAIFLPESEIPNLERVLLEHESRYCEMGKHAQQAFLEYFSDEKYFDYIIDQIITLKRRNSPILQRSIWALRNIIVAHSRATKFLKRRLTRR